MEELQQYKSLMTDIIAGQAMVLGTDIAIEKARKVKGIMVGCDGVVTEIVGDNNQLLQALINEYVMLSGMIVKNLMEPVIRKYPAISINQINK